MDTETRPLYMLSARNPPLNKGHIQTECEGLEKDISFKTDQEKAEVAILISDKVDFEIMAVERDKEGQNDQRINPRRRYQNYNYTFTQHTSTTICKANENKYDKGN